MTNQPPTPKILEICDLLEEFIRGINHVKLYGDFGYYEAPVEAGLLLKQAIKQVTAMIILARTDLVLCPSGCSLARIAFEICLRIRWLLYPEDSFEREARWLAHITEEEDLWKRLSNIAETTGDAVVEYTDSKNLLESARLQIQAKLPPDVKVPSKVPSVRDILKEQGDERRYIAYSLLSQYIHGGRFANTGLYRRGISKNEGLSEIEFVDFWFLCLRITWWSLYYATNRFVEVACEPGTNIATKEQIQTLDRLVNR